MIWEVLMLHVPPTALCDVSFSEMPGNPTFHRKAEGLTSQLEEVPRALAFPH